MELQVFINEVSEWVDILDCDFEELRDKAGTVYTYQMLIVTLV